MKKTLIALMIAGSAYAQAPQSQVVFHGLVRQNAQNLTQVLSGIDTPNLGKDGVRALMATGLFSDVRATQNGKVWVFDVTERPTIAQIILNGNKLLPKEGVMAGLKSAGIVTGAVYQPEVMQAVAQEIMTQYGAQGYFDAKITPSTRVLDGGRVDLVIDFNEGKQLKVSEIALIGNQSLDDKTIKRQIPLKDKNLNPLSKKDRYSDEALEQSIKTITREYQNRGHARAGVYHQSVQIDGNRAYVELGIDEGQVYDFGDVSFVGDTVYPSDVLHALSKIKKGARFSIDDINETSQAIATKLGEDGYYFAQVRAVQKIQDNVVNVVFEIEPNLPMTVRRIHINGNFKTNDETVRREIRQLEGALASNQNIALSQARLMRTGYFKSVTIEPKPIENLPDQMDLVVNVEEQPSGSSTIAAGYSQNGGVTFQLDLTQNNFLGTGNKININFARSQSRENYNLGLIDPYFTRTGVSQSISGYYRRTRESAKNINNYVTDSLGGALSYGYPINEYSRLNAGLALDKTHIKGGAFMTIANVDELLDDGGKADLVGGTSFEHNYKGASLSVGYGYSSLDRPMFPNKGMEHSADLTLAFGDKTYQKAVYRGSVYRPLTKGFIAHGYARLGYGHNLPFYENFYAGGYGSVRGYEPQSLGPRSQPFQYAAGGQRSARGNEIGGNALVSMGAELILPLPFKGDWTTQMRPALFIEGAQVFDTTKKDKKTFAPSRVIAGNTMPAQALSEGDSDMRYSAGLGLTWNTPIGPIAISYAMPIKHKANDEIDKVQFQIGNVF